MNRLQGKIAIVTGCARGIGRSVAELFVAEGAVVIGTDLETPGDSFKSGTVDFSLMDVSDPNAWRDLVERVVSAHGRVDVLVNNAGIGGRMESVLDPGRSDWDTVIAVNQGGVFHGMREVLPHMIERQSGSIVNFSSVWGVAAVPIGAAYQASKAAVRQLTKHAAVAAAPHNVRVNSIHPGIVNTPTIAAQPDEATRHTISKTPLGRMAEPIEIAFAVLFLASDESSFVTGSELVVDGGYLAQ